MIRHCVFLNVRPDHDPVEIASVFDGLAALCDGLANTSGFVAGPNRDFEGKSRGFASGFTIDFGDAEALQIYADHPEHKALGGRLVAQCTNGPAGIMVFDLDVPNAG